MTVIGKITLLGTKLGIVGGLCYYTKEVGLWGDSKQSEQLYKDMYKVAAPYLKQTPVEVPELPRVSDLTRALTDTWNQGVIATFGFMSKLPTHVSTWTATAYNKVNELVSDPKPPTT